MTSAPDGSASCCSAGAVSPTANVSASFSPASGGGGVKDSTSGGGGVKDSGSGAIGSAPFAAFEAPFPDSYDGVAGLESPRMIPSSTSLLRDSVLARRLDRSAAVSWSVAREVRLFSSSCSRPAMSSVRALMLLSTAEWALANVFINEASFAACTGGLGTGVFGSLSFPYSVLAFVTTPLALASALLKAVCDLLRGSSSDGTLPPDPPNKLPPSLPPPPPPRWAPLVLSTSSSLFSSASWILTSKMVLCLQTSTTLLILFCTSTEAFL